ncbi:MAG: metallophosphoesterase [Gemmatimonadaceae bacterium]
MKTTVREERLLVISDVHMGNRLHRPRREFMNFVNFALENRYSLCINGDGIDISQLSLSHLMADLTPSLALFVKFGQTDLNIYYTVGNHDIALEHFLSDIGRMKVLPFVTILSGDRRIRIEHGHMYDGMFLKFPRLYELFTLVGRLAIGVSPKFYDALQGLNHGIIHFAEWLLSRFSKKDERVDGPVIGIEGERECFRDGAHAVGMRGFDAVVFGHTHLAGTFEFENGVRYYNTGAWFSNPHCVAIDRGRTWYGPVADLTKNGDPFPLSDDALVASITGMFPAQRRGSVMLKLSAAEAAAIRAAG